MRRPYFHAATPYEAMSMTEFYMRLALRFSSGPLPTAHRFRREIPVSRATAYRLLASLRAVRGEG